MGLLRALLDDALHDPIGNAHVESLLRYLLGLLSRGNTRIEMLLDFSHQLQVIGVVILQWDLRNLSYAKAVTAVVSVSRRARQHNRDDEQDGDGHADREIDETHAHIYPAVATGNQQTCMQHQIAVCCGRGAPALVLAPGPMPLGRDKRRGLQVFPTHV
jgi:hypothetical protein